MKHSAHSRELYNFHMPEVVGRTASFGLILHVVDIAMRLAELPEISQAKLEVGEICILAHGEHRTPDFTV